MIHLKVLWKLEDWLKLLYAFPSPFCGGAAFTTDLEIFSLFSLISSLIVTNPFHCQTFLDMGAPALKSTYLDFIKRNHRTKVVPRCDGSIAIGYKTGWYHKWQNALDIVYLGASVGFFILATRSWRCPVFCCLRNSVIDKSNMRGYLLVILIREYQDW